MADIYVPDNVPLNYDPAFIQRELERISEFLREIEAPLVTITPQHVEPEKRKEGMIANADGTNWNPGGGAGLYQYLSGAWVKL